ncbi:ribonuclease HIII [Prosthecobacter sp. SYSU 5D2]|uniref:ribonuclease HIII n=1 Tax=Prosthecobacter sp. SYSU 5D2 TaxID=3134134 RepID=UPI0031FF369B
MPPITSYTKPLNEAQAVKLRALLMQQGWEFETKPHCLYAASRGKVNVAVYQKGPKILVQGKETEDFVTLVLEPQILGQAELGYEEVLHPEMFQPHIGVDESGKGDFFGPLVIAGVYVDAAAARHLREAGAVDSKRITSDAKIEQVAQAIRSVPGLRYEIVQINPERYNALYEKFGNLNRLLAWGHAKVIELLLERVPDCPQALSDQFANPAVLQRALQAKGREIELIQRTKAESDPAVAAASVLAREKFVHWLRDTGLQTGIPLPKGVSALVKASARQMLQAHGSAGLAKVAKWHFKTTAEILSSSDSEGGGTALPQPA